MKVLPCLAFSALAGSCLAQTTFREAFDKEQTERQKCSAIYDAKADEHSIRAALAKLEKLKAWCLSDGVRDLKSPDGTRVLYFQRNDILVDEIAGLARIRDGAGVLQCLRELRDSLTAPDSWLQGDKLAFFSTYADSITDNTFFSKLPPNGEERAILADMRRRDPNHILSSLPYLKGDRDKVSVTDRLAGLSVLWSEAKYNFGNFALVPTLDWDEAYRLCIPKVIAARDTYSYYNLLREFLAKLKDGHTDVNLPISLREAKEVKPPLATGLVEGKVVIWRQPIPDTANLGFRLGDVIERIDGLDAVEYGRKTWGTRVSCSTSQDYGMRVYSYMLLRGPRDRAAELQVEHQDGSRQTIRLPRNGKPLPAEPASDFKLLPDGTAYFAFNTCENDGPSRAFVDRLPQIQKAGRLIIDCRQNDGGSSDVGDAILSHLISTSMTVGQWHTRDYRPSFRAWNQPLAPYGEATHLSQISPTFAGPVVVIVGPRTFSAGEDFVSEFKSCRRGRIVGMPTGGSTGQPLRIDLPGGGFARICTKHDQMADGTEFVGVGILPDVRTEPTLADFRAGRDRALEVALQEIDKSRGP